MNNEHYLIHKDDYVKHINEKVLLYSFVKQLTHHIAKLKPTQANGSIKKMAGAYILAAENLFDSWGMEQADTINMAAYLRKMAIDGYVVKLELPELRDLISLLRRTSNNFNQIARRVNSTDRIYADDIHEMKTMIEQTWEATNQVLEKLAAID